VLCVSRGAAQESLQGVIRTAGASGETVVVPGAAVELVVGAVRLKTISDDKGRFSFSDVPASPQYQIEATAPGLNGSQTIIAGSNQSVVVDLQVDQRSDSVTVSANTSSLDTETSSQAGEVERATVVNAPNKYDQIDALLPMIPGVVRGPDGLINMKGGRSSQGSYLVNSANVTDPVTGDDAMRLPIDVVESVKVISDPYDPEYGRLTGAVSSLQTTDGNFDHWHATVQNLFLRPRKRDGDFIGIESATPRGTVTGPIVKNKIAFTQSFEYRFIRTPVSSLPQLERDQKLEGFNSYTQVDANLTARQSLTASFALYPQKLNYLGLNTFNPQPSTPDFHQRGYMASLQHRYTLSPSSVLTSEVSHKTFDADLTPNSSAPYELAVETTTGGFFDRQARRSERTEWQETWEIALQGFGGSHIFKAGTDYAHSSYDGTVHLLPVSILGVADSPIEQIVFGPQSRFAIRDNQVAWFAGDHWTPFQALSVDLGVRFDHDSLTGEVNPAPRFGVVVRLTRDQKTLLRGGLGLFYDRVPLNVASFPFLPDRTVESLDSTGGIVASTMFANVLTNTLRDPRSIGWNAELDRQITSGLTARAEYQQRNSTRDFVVNPEASAGYLSLSNGGESSYRELQFSGQYRGKRGTLNASYVRSRAYGDLNDFNQFFGNNPVAVIEPDVRARLPFDAPSRFLAWGQWNAPFKLTVLPVLDIHTGFPYSIVDQAREFVGPRDADRYPRFASLDLQITRPIRIPLPHEKFKARIGFSVFNVLNRFNPRDVQNDIDSDRFDSLFNGVGRTFRGKFVLEF
jgi:hypothetical protein